MKQRKGWRMNSAMTITMSSVHSPTFSSLHLRHSSFSNPSVASPTSQFILQPFRCFIYVTVHSPTLLSLLLRHCSSLNSLGKLPMLLTHYTPNNDFKFGQVSECKDSIFELTKFYEHWISRYQSHENIASMTSLGIV